MISAQPGAVDLGGAASLYVWNGTHRFHVVAQGDGPPLVLLHGGGPGSSGWSDFRQVLPLFARSHRTLAVDLLQYGSSDKPIISAPMWSFHAEQLAALLDTLEIGRADFACNSWGGSVALRFAASYPDRVRALVVTGAMPLTHGPSGPLPATATRGRQARDDYYGGEGPTPEKMRALLAELEWADGTAVPDETVELRYRQSLDAEEIARTTVPEHRGAQEDLSGALAAISAPVLFLWGRNDAFLPPEYALMLSAAAPRGSVAVVEGVGHHLQEERPQLYHALVDGFLAECAP